MHARGANNNRLRAKQHERNEFEGIPGRKSFTGGDKRNGYTKCVGPEAYRMVERICREGGCEQSNENKLDDFQESGEEGD